MIALVDNGDPYRCAPQVMGQLKPGKPGANYNDVKIGNG